MTIEELQSQNKTLLKMVRKIADDTRKQTAKEIWRDLLLSFTSIGNGQMVIDEKDFIKAMRNYGVEVDE